MLAMAVLHGSEGTGVWVWTWQPSVLIGLGLLTALYLLAVGPLRRRAQYGLPVPRGRIAAFLAGNLILFLALVSPLDHISDEYLFSAHMVQHILLISFVPVLWLIGLPDGLLNFLARPVWLRRAFYDATRPLPAFLTLNAVLLFWHIPTLYDAALASENLHIVEHLSFLAAAVIGWWPLFGRFEEAAPRAGLVTQIFYVFFMMFPSTALAAWVALTPTILYPFYGNQPLVFGLTPLEDQQLSGMIMWIPGNALNFIVFTFVFFRWMRQSAAQDTEDDRVFSETAETHQES